MANQERPISNADYARAARHMEEAWHNRMANEGAFHAKEVAKILVPGESMGMPKGQAVFEAKVTRRQR